MNSLRVNIVHAAAIQNDVFDFDVVQPLLAYLLVNHFFICGHIQFTMLVRYIIVQVQLCIQPSVQQLLLYPITKQAYC